ncbi:unnamed protein product, partial [Rotaria sp. Silwood2]
MNCYRWERALGGGRHGSSLL